MGMAVREKREYAKGREVMVTFRVSPEVKEWIVDEARRDGRSTSAFCRAALMNEYARRRR